MFDRGLRAIYRKRRTPSPHDANRMAKRKQTSKPREFKWSTHPRYQRSPCGCGKTAIWTESGNAYRVVWFRDQKDRPYLAQRYHVTWPDAGGGVDGSLERG
jgi:hypothetical protein